jgi:lysophospholipase L1-like esterase
VRVALIGDSIRMNAQPFVRECLPFGCSLYAPDANCESSRSVRAHLDAWLPPGTFDVLHINCGLHDIRHDPGRSHPVCSAHEYADNLRAIFDALTRGGATIVWATSTPIDEVRHNAAKASRRYRADLLEYNRISVEIANACGIRVHDLHAKLLRTPSGETSIDDLLLPDGVHFTPAGSARIGAHIADAILSAAR